MFKMCFSCRNSKSNHSISPTSSRLNPGQESTCSSTVTSSHARQDHSPPSPSSSLSPNPSSTNHQRSESPSLFNGPGKGKRGRPRKHAPKLPLPPLYVFIRNLLHNPGYNPSVIAWVDDEIGCFKVKVPLHLLL